MKNISQLARPNIQKLSPYISARMQNSGQNYVFLDANENRYWPGFEVKLNDETINVSEYPDPYQIDLKKKIISSQNYKQYNLTLDTIYLSNGSDEVIDMLVRIFCEPGKDKILISSPTFGMYKVAGEMNDVEVIDACLNIKATWEKNLKLIFICRPNNPTWEVIDVKIIEWILKKFEWIVVIDEAYIDFSDFESLIYLLPKYQNLVVLQTVSKSYWMAGVRLWMTFASKEIIDLLNKIKMPYNINVLTQKVVLKAFESSSLKRRKVNLQKIEKNKNELIRFLSSLSYILKVYPSEWNFIFCESAKAIEIYEYLKENGIVIRYFPKMKDKLRITIGTDENIEIIKELLSNYK